MKNKLIILTLILSMLILAGCTQKKDIATNDSNDNSSMTVDKAKEMVLIKVPGATHEHIVKFKLETENNHSVYDGTIYYNGKEYDFEIDANTGEILEWDVENI